MLVGQERLEFNINIYRAMNEIIAFLDELRLHNDKVWFDANRERYHVLRDRFCGFVERLISGIGTFDASVRGLSARECVFRINRDIRFSPNKAPYKTNMGAFIAPHGKNSGYAGYYFHLEPAGGEMIGSNILAAGIVFVPPVVLRSLRDEIFDNGDEMVAAINRAKGFTLDRSSALSRTPKGFPAGSPHDDLLRLKDLCLERPIPSELLDNDERLLEWTVDRFRSTYGFIAQLNRAVQYAFEEMM